MQSWFDNREIAAMALSLEHYINMAECPESESIKAELREIVRKLHCVLDEERIKL